MAISAPDRLPAKPGLMYSPPVQSVMLVYWCFLRAVGGHERNCRMFQIPLTSRVRCLVRPAK